jgi:hypothetical protein
VAAYEATHAGLTWSEHLYIYRYRNKFLCTDDEVKLLLQSHLLGNGPIWYWARKYSKANLVGWTKELLVEGGEEIQKGGYEFLIKIGEKPDLAELASVFSDYTDQDVLAKYIRKFATVKDVELLIKLNRKKAEEVVKASQAALVEIVGKRDKSVLEKMARSNSRNTMRCFEEISRHAASEFSTKELREGINSRPLWFRLLCLYGLGDKGTSDDLCAINKLTGVQKGQKLKGAAIKASTRIAMRLGDEKLIEGNLKAHDKFTIEKTLEAIDKPSNAIRIKDVMALYKRYYFSASRAILAMATRKYIPVLKKILSEVSLEPPARDLVYALCTVGGEAEFTFLFKLFLRYKERIDFWNTFAVVTRVSELANKSHISMLRSIINAEEFWRYYRYDERPKHKIPVANYDNVYFLKRLTGTAFGAVATRREFPSILKMLRHDYWVIRNAALEGIRKWGSVRDLSKLLAIPANGSNMYQNEGVIKAICLLDERASLNE